MPHIEILDFRLSEGKNQPAMFQKSLIQPRICNPFAKIFENPHLWSRYCAWQPSSVWDMSSYIVSRCLHIKVRVMCGWNADWRFVSNPNFQHPKAWRTQSNENTEWMNADDCNTNSLGVYSHRLRVVMCCSNGRQATCRQVKTPTSDPAPPFEGQVIKTEASLKPSDKTVCNLQLLWLLVDFSRRGFKLIIITNTVMTWRRRSQQPVGHVIFYSWHQLITRFKIFLRRANS